ncbi:MAG: xylan 1,4-beta-xylosidase [Coriobacteriia bacterium]|nr:MAG: xylan 1,4-beta-xylosidase [Coriobacteriia bacterium]
MKENGDRFVQAYMQRHGLANRTYVLVDRQTGVNYLLAGFLASSGVSCTGMTALVGADGKPIVTPIEE